MAMIRKHRQKTCQACSILSIEFIQTIVSAGNTLEFSVFCAYKTCMFAINIVAIHTHMNDLL